MCSSKSFEDGVIFISKSIANGDFQHIDNDLDMIDSIYVQALKFYEGDVSEALLALTFATLPFNKMPVTIPLINIKLDLKLPSVNPALFNLKKQLLPGNVFFDSNKAGIQDKDKVAHFFGNAFLAYNVSQFNISKFLGLIVEIFESTFGVSRIDPRDIKSNYLGEFFGTALRNNNNLKPSQFLIMYSLFYFSYN